MDKQPSHPFELARETLKTLASRKIPPTPDNYARIYAEIGGIAAYKNNGAEKVLRGIADHLIQIPKFAPTGMVLKRVIGTCDWEQCVSEIEKILPKQGGDTLKSWSDLIRDLLRQLETTHKGLTVSRKKEGLESVLSRFATNQEVLFEKLNALIRSWSESPVTANIIETSALLPATGSTSAQLQGGSSEMVGKLAELLAQTLESVLGMQPELAKEVQILTNQVRGIRTYEQIIALSRQLRQFWIRIELQVGDKARVHEGLVRLLRLLVENIGEMVEDEEWLHGQIAILQEIIANPVDSRAIAAAERSLRDAIIKQSMLKHSLVDAKGKLKSLMATFIDRLGEITASTGEYHQKIDGYSKKICKSNNLTELSHLLDDIMQDTRIIQASALRSHDELVGTRKQVEEAETRIRELEQELAQVSERVREDQLTGALNRRGMDEAFEREAARADRSHAPLCVALLDVDNFKHLNDTLGHHVGDRALIHLCEVIKEGLRPGDSVARYGGEEFIIILPEIVLEEAAATIERLQRWLTKKFFLHENNRLLITFSAGVVQYAPDESREDVMARADKAMYQAKKAGRNRVVMAK